MSPRTNFTAAYIKAPITSLSGGLEFPHSPEKIYLILMEDDYKK